MKSCILLYIILNILPFGLNKKTFILRGTGSTNGDETKTKSKEISNSSREDIVPDVPNDFKDDNPKEVSSENNENCWMSLNAKQHFRIMDNLDERYRKVRSDYQQQLGGDLDKKMLDTLLEWRGVAQREAFKNRGKTNLIPAGLNLGGYCMMKMKDSVLFFHRIKLRNQTHFRVNFLHTDVENMELVMRLSLNDLHLLGAYERSPVDKDPSVLFYAPTFGEVEFLLKNVDYKMEAQLRLLNNKLIIELVTSKLTIEDILMMYTNRADNPKPIRLIKENIEDFIDRMKTDLDKWLRDYFNDYLTYFGSLETPSSEFMKAEKDKIIALNEYADTSLNIIKTRLRRLGADTVKVPHFTIYGPNQMKLQLKEGSLRGLDSIYRRSVTTAKKENDIRKVNLIVGFSNLKVMYKYEAFLRVEVPPLIGIIVLSANEITAHMELSLLNDPETVDLEFDFIQQMKPESLTVEGAASRMIANFKHLLEHHIIAIMSNAVIHNIKMLRTLSRCEPMLLGQHKSNNYESFSKGSTNDDVSKEDENDIDSQNVEVSQSNSDKSSNVNTNNSMSQNYLQIPPLISSDIDSGGMPSSGNDKSSSEINNHDSDNLFQNEEDISVNKFNPNNTDKVSSTNSHQFIDGHSQEDEELESSNSPKEHKKINSTHNTNFNEFKSHNESDYELFSEVEQNYSENGLSNENSDKTSSGNDNFHNTKYQNISDGFILSRNDSVELELSAAENFKGGKYKLTREEKMKLIKQ